MMSSPITSRRLARDGMTGQGLRPWLHRNPEKAMRTAALILTLIAAPALAAPVAAQSKIAADAHVTEVLLAARVGDVIRNTCPSISARFLAVYGEMNALKSYARGQGYSEDEVKAFLRDPAEKDRIKALAAAYLAKAGAREGDAESYCVVGRDEIAKGTRAGSLLRSWK